jgi:hypothetical protein
MLPFVFSLLYISSHTYNVLMTPLSLPLQTLILKTISEIYTHCPKPCMRCGYSIFHRVQPLLCLVQIIFERLIPKSQIQKTDNTRYPNRPMFSPIKYLILCHVTPRL